MKTDFSIKGVLSFMALFIIAVSLTGCSKDDGDDNTTNPQKNKIKVTCKTCSGSGDCLTCGGTGKGCPTCKGTGLFHCDQCNDTGKYCKSCNTTGICTKCNGTGVSCSDCKGSGKCWSCNGRGYCDKCYGSGKLTCYICDGLGKNWITNKTCYKCGGTGKVACHMCFGSGDCDICLGSGKCNGCHGRPECSSCNGSRKCKDCGGNAICSKCQGQKDSKCKDCGGDGHCPSCANSNGKCTKCEGLGYTWEDEDSINDDNDDIGNITGSSCPDDNHPHAIDLGLPSGTKWACCNLGANKPEGYGKYYTWGDTEAGYGGSWEKYKYGNSEDDLVDIGSDISGTSYDAARANWGGTWRMPTQAECQELIDNTNYELSENFNGTGSNGIVFKSKTNASKFIFFPFTSRYAESNEGVGSVWTSTVYKTTPYYAMILHFDALDVSSKYLMRRFYSDPIRPVK